MYCEASDIDVVCNAVCLQIVDLETGIMILKEDMIQERADARREKKHLKQCVVRQIIYDINMRKYSYPTQVACGCFSLRTKKVYSEYSTSLYGM